jgi:hypothetical protein
MQRLVLITYLTLALAAVGQALHTQKQAPGTQDKQQTRDVPNLGADADTQDTALEHTERKRKTAEDPVESASLSL